MKSLFLFVTIIILSACSDTEKERITRLVKEWDGKEIQFPDYIVYTIYGKDTVNYTPPQTDYTIVSYVDSVGCTSCKLQLHRWVDYIQALDSLAPGKVSYQFIFHPKDKRELTHLLKRDKFDFPVWIDDTDKFVHINALPKERIFHSFLLDGGNRVIAIGDPVQNPRIRALYEKVITGGDIKPSIEVMSTLNTSINLEQIELDLGEFDWQEAQNKSFAIHNTGKHMLVINDIITSCGCMKVVYSQEPLKPGDQLQLKVIYQADSQGYIDKTLKIFANIDASPVVLKVKGKAK